MEDLMSPAAVCGSLSIDRVTFLILTPSLSLWTDNEDEYQSNRKRLDEMCKFVTTVLKDELDEDFPQGSSTPLFRHHYRTIDDVDIQFGSQMPKRKKVTNESLIETFGTVEDQERGYMFQYSPNSYAFRIEYNPNKTNLMSVKRLLELFPFANGIHSIRIARLDIAIDYPASIVPELVLVSSMKKGALNFGTEGIETLYYGKRQSKNMFRIYNKRKEILEKEGRDLGHDLWRVELESKESFYLDNVPDHGEVFRRVSFCDGAVTADDWKVELIRGQAMIWGLETVLRKLPKQTAIRYRKMFREQNSFRQDIETPSFVYAREFPAAMDRLRCDILNACGFKLAI